MNQDARHRLTIESLRNLSFTLDTWDRRGFVSSNGAGKTTLLSIMVGIYEPVAGRIGIDGAVTSIAGPESGTNFELTGNRKYPAACAVLRLFGRADQGVVGDMAEFSELEDFLSLPVRTYSSVW